MENSIQVFNNADFGQMRTIEINGKTMFCGKDVAIALGYSNPRDAISSHCKGAIKGKIATNGGVQTMALIPEEDLWNIINRSETVTSEYKLSFINWIKSLGFLQKISLFERKEIAFVSKLSKVLSAMNIISIPQYSILSYRIDLYIPEYKLCVEYDENNHSGYSYEAHEGRQKEIESLSYKFVRVSDDKDDEYNIGVVINKIFNK